MGSFAGKRKTGTDTLLFTSTRSEILIVLGKFLSAVVMTIIIAIISLVYYVIVCSFTNQIVNIQSVITTLIGFLLVSMSYISFWMLVSSLIENQIIAGVVTAVLIVLSSYLPNLSLAFSVISPVYLFKKYPYGILATTSSIIMILQIIMFITLTIIFIEKRKILKKEVKELSESKKNYRKTKT